MSRSFWLFLALAACDPSGIDGTQPVGNVVQDRISVGPDVANVVHTCPELPAPPEGELCAIEGDPATATHLLFRADILNDLAAYDDGTVLVERGTNGLITCVGCDCAAEAPESTLTITCPEGVLSPGLINAHDHIAFDLSYPEEHGDERFDHRHDWRRGSRGHTRLSATSNNSREATLFVEMRMLLSGVTSIAGSMSGTGGDGLLRNLDTDASNGGLGSGSADYRTFPLGDSGGRMSSSGCGAYDMDSASRLNASIYLPHIAEGLDANARNEFLCLSGQQGGTNLIARNTSIIHGIGLKAPDIAHVGQVGAKLVWSPRSNISLYGETAPVSVYRSFNVDIAMGTDWTPSGSATMLRELQCADSLNSKHYGGLFSDRELWLMATRNGGIAMGQDRLGRIRPGQIADLALFDGRVNPMYRAVIEAGIDDVELVLRGSKVLTGDRDLVEGLVVDSAACEALPDCLSDHLVCVSDDTGMTLARINSRVGGYPLAFCEVPADEPSCEPLRQESDGAVFPTSSLSDLDGDGMDDAEDNCPDVFNPRLPLHDFIQADADADGLGDACDPCPTDAGNVCAFRDADGDGLLDLDDNCVYTANPDQADADGDFVGDACEGGEGPPTDPIEPPCTDCLASVYDVKSGVISTGSSVSLDGLQVTGVGSSGFFVQVPSDDAGYQGPDHAGLYVHVGSSPNLDRGDRLRFDGVASEYFGQRQVNDVRNLVVLSSDHADPAPISVTAAEVANGGSRAAALEGSLVVVSDATVTAIALSPGAGETAPTGAFEVNGSLRVDDYFYGVSPSVGDTYGAIAGVLRWSNGSSKLEPRGPADLVTVVVPTLSGLNPSQVLLGAGVSTDAMLAVSLNTPAVSDVVVGLSCTPASVLSCDTSVTVPAGQSVVGVPLSGLQAGEATVQAWLGSAALSASVTVFEEVTGRALVGVSPASLVLDAGEQGVLNVELDLPAPAGGTLIEVDGGGLLAGSVSLVIPEGDVSGSVAVTAGAVAGSGDILLSTDGSALLVPLTVVAVTTPVPGGGTPFFSRYLEGSSGNNKFLEITHLAGGSYDLGACEVRIYGNGSTSPNTPVALSGSLASGGAFTVCHSSATYPTDHGCDLSSSGLGFNGDDAVVLWCDGDVVDVIGRIGEDPGSAWGTTVSTANSSLVRSCSVQTGDANGSDAFDPAQSWVAVGQDDALAFGTARVCP